MERREEKKSSNFGVGLLAGLGVAAVGFGAFKLMENLFKDNNNQRREREVATNNNDRIKPDFSDVDNGNNNFKDDESYVYCDDDIFLCPISKEFMRDPYILTNCGHSFEKKNIYQWLQRKGVCPLCNRKAEVSDLIPNFQLKNVMLKKKSELRAKNF